MEGFVFNCDICLFQTKFQNRLYLHKQEKHVERIFKCNMCDFTSSLKQAVNTHTRIKHNCKKLQCNQCTFVHDYSSELNKHVKKEHGPKIIEPKSTCSLCDWEGPKERYKVHQKSLHGESHKCENCGKEFKRREHLTIHNNAVHLKIKHPCDNCDYKATNSGS